jgi:hypothetical protein
VCVTVSGDGINVNVNFGEILVLPLGVGEFKNVQITPGKNFDVGAGKGKQRNERVEGGTVGLIIDARGRPFGVELNTPNRVQKLRAWLQAFGLPLP